MVWKSRRFVFMADDFGLNAETNQAIIHSHENGVLDSAGLMMGQPGTKEAVDWARRHHSLETGLHFHLNDSAPLLEKEWPWGDSPVRAGWALGLSSKARKLAGREIRAQWKAYSDTGLACSFVNFHHHLHMHPWVYRELLKTVPGSFQGWIRLGTPRFFPGEKNGFSGLLNLWMDVRREKSAYPSPDHLWGVDRTFAMCAEEVVAAMKKAAPGIHEFIFHPRRVEGDLDTQCLIDLKKLALPA